MMVRAKFKVESKVHSIHGHQVRLEPVYGGSPENEEFFRFTPGGEIKLMVVKPETAERFEVGKEYYVDFHEAGSVKPHP